MSPDAGTPPSIRGRWTPPGDKSLSHRALLFAAIAGGAAELSELNRGEDVESTARVLRALGVEVARRGSTWRVSGSGSEGWTRPRRTLDCGNSGTTMRLMAGALAGRPFESRLAGDASLSARPMGRVVRPLRRLGAEVAGRERGGSTHPPLRLRGGSLTGGVWKSPVASAQVKSAVLLAGLVGGVAVEAQEPHRSRDHTERMLRALGARVRRVAGGVRFEPGGTIRAPEGRVPGDPSAGSFFAAAAAALRGSDLTIDDVCVNPTRLGFFRVLSRMGARVDVARTGEWCGEPIGRIRVRPGRLHGVRLAAASIPALVDEIPVLAVLAAGAAKGRTTIRGAEELRVKETDRLAAMSAGLRALGADVEERPDGLTIAGGKLAGGTVEARGDHRVAMAFRIAGLLARGRVRVRGAEVVRVSHPSFPRDLKRLSAGGSSA